VIKNESAYQKAVEKLAEDLEYIEQEKARLKSLGLDGEQIEAAIQPLVCFHQQLKEEVAYYEAIKRGVFNPIHRLTDIGKSLIAYRIYINMTQAELADKLEVSEAQVSRDERHEYYGASIDKIEKVMAAMGMVTTINIDISAGRSA
jgi:DNA-directed RNA polymerase specialized sigma subunit